MATLAELNDFSLAEDGVYAASQAHPFAYSDGEAAEIKLAEILESAADLSSASEELERQIDDWPSEYHLSGKRSNLLRPFNFDGVTRVLELGCGCGAISRYLGEQPGIHVDAIEGSRSRARLAAARCRDLDNVRVHCGNFNDLSIPNGEYDLVLLVGVTEYAGRFSERDTDQAALQDLLSMAHRAQTETGVTVIAIENRLGLKYVLGACEDHYGIPWVGIENYPDSSGIRTYSQAEWQHQVDESSFAEMRFCYPFPDYKVPTVMVDEDTVLHTDAVEAIATTNSRDYLQPFEIKSEPQVWSGLAQNQTLAEFANSFVLVLGQSAARVKQFASFGVARYQGADYQWVTPLVDANTQRLRNRLAEVAEKTEQLNAELSLLHGSKPVRVGRALRRLLGLGNKAE